MSLLDRRLQVVIGKGGVGKTTVSALMALVAQERGRRVLCCEMAAQPRIAGLLGAPAGPPEVRQIDRSIWTVHIQAENAMREYGLMVLRFKALYSAVFENRLVRYCIRAIPSLPEIVVLGKICFHVSQERDENGVLKWDTVVVDAPATGHGLALLRTPRNVLNMVHEGPMVRDMKNMQDTLHDPATTAVSIVTLPEEMPANEAVHLHQALHDFPEGPLFLNGYSAPRFTGDERMALVESNHDELSAARQASRFYGERQDLSALYEERLRREIPRPMVRLPFLPGAAVDRADLERLAVEVGSQL